MAILAGLFANFLVENMKLGPVSPFDASAAVLLIGGAVIATSWPENYGDSKNQHSLSYQFKAAAASILAGEQLALEPYICVVLKLIKQQTKP